MQGSITHPTNRATSPFFYFIVVFWGKVHRDYFLDLLLASLLSPNNIPKLENKEKNKFLICTTEEDWEAIQAAPIFLYMKNYIQPHFIKMEPPEPKASKMLVMSQGHKMASELAFNNAAIGVFLTPDLILSNGSVERLQVLARQNKKVVLCAAMRFEHHGCINEFKKLGVLKEGEPLNISSRQLISIAINNLHSETIRYLWNTEHFAETPVSCLWRSKESNDLVIHSFSWAPLLLNYAAIREHNTKTFEEWTLDGDYVYQNFGCDSSVYIVQDSDEIALVSFTKEEDLHIPAVIDKQQQRRMIGTLVKLKHINKLYFDKKTIDPLKRKLFLSPVFFHANGISFGVRLTAIKARILIFLALRFAPQIILKCILKLISVGDWRVTKQIKNIVRSSPSLRNFYYRVRARCEKEKGPKLNIFLNAINLEFRDTIKRRSQPFKRFIHTQIKNFMHTQKLRYIWLKDTKREKKYILIFKVVLKRLLVWCGLNFLFQKNKQKNIVNDTL